MKLHLCCGRVYLTGYINVDFLGKFSKPDQPGNSLLNYYLRQDENQNQSIIVDRKMDVTKIPWTFKKGDKVEDGSVEEIVMIDAIEHFTFEQGRFIAQEALRVLRPGGRFLVDFLDIAAIVTKYIYSKPELCMQYLFCQKDRNSVHYSGYTRGTFFNMLGSAWIIDFHKIVEHEMPTIGCEAIKR